MRKQLADGRSTQRAAGSHRGELIERPQHDDPLEKLARAIDEEHRQIQLAFKAGLLRIVRIGELLREAKARVGHGNWLNWIEQNTDLSRQTANRYMRMSRILPKVPNDSLVSHLRQCDVLRLPSPGRFAVPQGAADSRESAPTEPEKTDRGAAASSPPPDPAPATARQEPHPAGAVDEAWRALAGDVERFAAEVRRVIVHWPDGFHPRRALAQCLEMLAREVRATIPLAG